MKTTRILFFILCMMMILSFASVYAEGGEGVDEAKIIISEIDDHISSLIEEGEITGASAAIVKNGETVFLKGYGYADKAKGVETSPTDTAFRIGSVSKTFVAFAAMQLADKGLLDIHADIRNYVKDFPEKQYPITMHDLLTHTAGFEETGRGLAVESADEMTTLEYTVKEYLPEQIYKPGDTIAYSNYGVALAGYVIECVAGQEFYSYIRENIFEPIGMNNSAFSLDGTDKSMVSLAYGKDGEQKDDGTINFYPSGDITSTAWDMAAYMRELLSEGSEILNGAYKSIMFETQFTAEESFPGLGYSWGRYEQNGHLFYGHMGGTDNFSTIIVLCPEDNLGLFISCNARASEALGQIVGLVSKRLYGENTDNLQGLNYVEKETIDLEGSWCSTVRTEQGPEKIYNIFSTVKFNRDKKKGYEFMGKPFMNEGGDIFFHPSFGYLKYYRVGSREFLFTEESGALVKIPWYEGMAFQAIIIAAFCFITFAGFVFSTIRLIKRIKKGGKSLFETASYIIAILLFAALAVQIASIFIFFSDMKYAKVESFLLLKRILSYIVLALGTALLSSSIGMIFTTKGERLAKAVFGLIDIGFLMYLFWMLQMNLLV